MNISENEKRRLQKAKEFEEYVNNLEGYTLLSEYTTVNEHVLMKHNCGHEYKVRPSHFKTRGQRCKMCTRKKDREEAKQKLLDLMADEYSLLSEYKNNKTKVKIMHKECNSCYEVKPDNFFHGKRCPFCKTSSKGEDEIRNILNKYGIDFKEQYRIEECKNKKQLPFDFAIFKDNELKYLIEYQGIQHYKESSLFGKENFINTQINDNIKKVFCNQNNINLVEIKYDVKNIEEFLLNKINYN